MQKIIFIVLIFISFLQGRAQDKTLYAGIRLQKSVKLYYENGITVDYTQQKYLNNKIFIGFSYFSSRFGTAMGTNAIKQDNFLLQFSYHFRHEKMICPVVQINTGYFYADYGSPMFDVLPNTSALLSIEPGVFFNFKYPVKGKLSLGYNIITGDGLTGAGTLFPLYLQCSIYYQFNFIKKD